MEAKKVGVGKKIVYIGQFVITVFGCVLQAILTYFAFGEPHHEKVDEVILCIVENVVAMAIFVGLFIFAFSHFKKDGKFFSVIAILNASFATAQIASAQSFYAQTQSMLMSLLSIHLGLLVAFIVLLNTNSNRALLVMKLAIAVKIFYYLWSYGKGFFLNYYATLPGNITLPENTFGHLILGAKFFIPLLIDVSICLCYKAKLNYKDYIKSN